jgi:IS605 OrfB family transposase
MRATLKLKLAPTPEVAAVLSETLTAYTTCFNSVCSYGWQHGERNSVRLHQATYATLRAEQPSLPSQLVCAARVKATETLRSVEARRKRGKKVSCPQSANCPIRYDARSYWVKLSEGQASLATTNGRKLISFRLPDYYRRYLGWTVTSADLCQDGGQFFLHVVVEAEAPVVEPTETVVGCDLGVRRVAVTSTAKFFSSGPLHQKARHFEHLKGCLQRKGTRSAKRHLKKMRRAWSRFMRSANHLIANSILAGLAPGDTLVLEELTGIRDRCRHRKGQRGLFHRWSFHQLRSFLAYKAEQRGIRVLAVDPRNTSRTCPRCSHCDKANRKQQSVFCCQSCGYTANADFVAATNLRQKGIALLARPLSDGPSCQPPVSLFGTGTGLGASPQPSGGGI